jgi:hypothetical protein
MISQVLADNVGLFIGLLFMVWFLFFIIWFFAEWVMDIGW